MNLMVPVAVVAVWPPEATVAVRVTVVPWSTGLGGVGTSVVVVGVAGGGGSTSVPCRVRLITLPVDPAKRLFSDVLASPHVVVKRGMVKSVWEMVAVWVVES